MALVAGCMNNAESENPPVLDEPVAIPEQKPDEGDDSDFIADTENQIVFDFAELPGEDFPRGMWTINQLIDKYGPYESIESNRVIDDYDDILPPSIDVVIIKVSFTDIYIEFATKDTSFFSFYKEVQEPVEYPFDEECILSDADKNIELEILELTCYDRSLEFPYGHKIGQSSKTDILAAYPSGSANISQYTDKGTGKLYNEVYLDYDFRDETGNLPEWGPQSHGCISYKFDEADILKSVYIAWRWFSW